MCQSEKINSRLYDDMKNSRITKLFEKKYSLLTIHILSKLFSFVYSYKNISSVYVKLKNIVLISIAYKVEIDHQHT